MAILYRLKISYLDLNRKAGTYLSPEYLDTATTYGKNITNNEEINKTKNLTAVKK